MILHALDILGWVLVAFLVAELAVASEFIGCSYFEPPHCECYR